METRPIIAGVVCSLLGLALAGPASAAVDAAPDYARGRWEGPNTPSAVQYQPPMGEGRSAIRFVAPGKAAPEWLQRTEADLSECEQVLLHAVSPAAGTATFAVKCDGGTYRIPLTLACGEQILLLPLGKFERQGEADWSRVREFHLALPRGEPASLDLLGLSVVRDPGVPRDQGLCLFEPVTPLARHGALYPLYAILADSGHPELRFPEALQNYLSQMFGVKLPINPKGLAASPRIANVVLLGRSSALAAGAVTKAELDAGGYEGFVVRAGKGVIAIAGQTHHGAGYGLYRFLEKQGCRFYAPDCETIPRKETRVLLACDLADKPFFEKRISGFYSTGASGNVLGDPRAAENQDLWKDSTLWIDHTAPYLVPIKLYYKEHPEYFSLRADGTRLPGDTTDVRVMICTTHPDVLRISAERALRWIEMQKDRKFFCITQGDAMDWCLCPRCKAMEYEPGNCSDRMLYWVNYVARAVAKKYPDKVLITFAYGDTQAAPVKLRPEKNVLVLYCPWPNKGSAPCGIHDFDCPENVIARTQIEGWLKVAPQSMGIYDYNSGGRYTLYGMADRVKWCARHGLRGFWYCGTNLTFQPLFQYVHARLNWDPSLDVSRLEREFIAAYYGEAAPAVQEFVDLIYQPLNAADHSGHVEGLPTTRDDFYTPDRVTRALALLDKAEPLAGKHSAEVAQARSLFLVNSLYAKNPSRGEIAPDDAATFARCLKEYTALWLKQREAAAEKARAQGKPAPGFGELKELYWALARLRVEPGADGGVPAVVRDVLADAPGTLARERVVTCVTKIADGWRVPADDFLGGGGPTPYGWYCTEKMAAWVRGRMTDASRMGATLALDAPPPDRDGVLEIEGQDSDKIWCAPAPIQIFVNRRKVFEGPNGFVKRGWSRRSFPLPKGTLHAGDNVIEIRNLAGSDSVSSDWFMLSEALVRFLGR